MVSPDPWEVRIPYTLETGVPERPGWYHVIAPDDHLVQTVGRLADAEELSQSYPGARIHFEP